MYLLQIKEAIEQEQERKALNRAASDMSREQFIQTWFNPEGNPDPALCGIWPSDQDCYGTTTKSACSS